MKTAAAALAFLLATTAFAARYAGRPLVDALRDLEQRGLHLIYSSEVIQPELTVHEEPRSTEPRAILDELLRQHRLRAVAGPKGTLVIVRDEGQPQRRTPEPAAPAMPVTVDQIVVTPSHFGMLGSQPEQRQFLSREEVHALPHFGDDIYRAINRIPGSATNDVSASFNLRGGVRDEVEVLLDGVEIYEPFHVKDLLNIFSILDAEAMGSVDILTGGFPAEYGGRMSGVIDVASLTPTERRTQIGIGILNSRALSAGTFGDNRGQWLLSLRPGYLHEVLQLINADTTVDPSYYDLFGKLQWQVSDSTIVSAGVLASHDRLLIDATDVQARTRSGDRYVWLNARRAITPRLFTQNVISTAAFTHSRQGSFVEIDEQGALDDRRSFRFVTWKDDTSFEAGHGHTLKGGFKVSRLDAHYDFTANALQKFLNGAPTTVDRAVTLQASGNDVAAYASDRIAIRPNVVVEAGVRADRQSYAPDGTHVTPRLNAGWAVTPSTSLRAAWGRFAQPERIDELPVGDGVTVYSPAQVATHAVLGLDQRFRNGWSARLETYDKRISHPRERFENRLNSLTVIPEIRADRIRVAPSRGTARGTELLVRRDGDGPWSGWFTLVRSSVRDDIDGRMVPRAWDQRDAAGFSVNYGYPDRWNVNLAGTYHSGWPTTSVSGSTTPLPGGGFELHLVPGPLNDDRLPAYARVDLRASRNVRMAPGRLSFFIEVFNLFGRANVSRVDGFDVSVDRAGNVTTRRRTTSIVPATPSFGAAWQF